MEFRKKITGYTIHLDSKLGEGAFGKVYVGEEDNSKKRVAIKVLEKQKFGQNEYFKKALFAEIDILKSVQSPNIVGFLDVMESNNSYYIIQQLCNGGELRKLMTKRGRIPEAEAVEWLKQICNGFVELLREGVMHRDLKPQNILIHDNILKIADFGFSKKAQDKVMQVQTIVGTPLYMPLQILKDSAYSSKCDIWALGCIFYEMLEGRTPWNAKSQYELITNIETKPLNFYSTISKPVKEFIKKCLAVDEKDRFSWDELLKHQIFYGYFNKNQSDYQNKYKQIMNNIRYMVKVKSVDLEKWFTKIGYSAKTSLQYSNFKQLITNIDQQLTQEQVKYTFGKINESGSGSLSYAQFYKALLRFNIPATMPKQNSVKSDNSNYTKVLETVVPIVDKVLPPTLQQINYKLNNTLLKLVEKLKQKKMSIYQVLDAYKCTEKGYLNVLDFSLLLKIADKTYTDEEVNLAFSLIDKAGCKKIPCQNLVKYFYEATNVSKTNKSEPPPLQKKYSTPDDPRRLTSKQSQEHQQQHGYSVPPPNSSHNSSPSQPQSQAQTQKGVNMFQLISKQVNMNPQALNQIFLGANKKMVGNNGWDL